MIILKENYVHINEKYQELKQKQDEKTKEMLNRKESQIVSKKLTRNNILHFNEFDELTLDITNDKLNKNERKFFKKLPTVKSYEVKTMGYEMSLRFQILKIDLNTVMNKVKKLHRRFNYLFFI